MLAETFRFVVYGHGSTRSRDQIPVKVSCKITFSFTKYLPENLENTTEHDRERLSTLYE